MFYFAKLAVVTTLSIAISTTGATSETTEGGSNTVSNQQQQREITKDENLKHIEGGVVKPEDMYISLEEVTYYFSQNVDTKCQLSKDSFIELMENLPYDYEGFYSRNAEFIWEMEQEYEVNALVYCGISAIESGWGVYGASDHNYTGMMGSEGLIYFQSDEEGIEATFANIAENYVPYGADTLSGMAEKYAGSYSWADQVYSAISMIISQ